MLQNEYLVAKIGFDTAEKEPSKVCPQHAAPGTRAVAVYRTPTAPPLRRGSVPAAPASPPFKMPTVISDLVHLKPSPPIDHPPYSSLSKIEN